MRVVLRIVAFVLPLGLDTLALSLALGLRNVGLWRPALVFALFEGIMPLLGIALGRLVGLRFETLAVVVGGLILMAVGVHAIQEALSDSDEAEQVSFSSARSSLLAGIAISTDELAIGFPLGASGLPLAPVLIAIAMQAFVVTALGIMAGNRIGAAIAGRASRYAGVAAGIVFFLVGAWLIGEKLSTHRVAV